jgi:hypothetical protein
MVGWHGVGEERGRSLGVQVGGLQVRGIAAVIGHASYGLLSKQFPHGAFGPAGATMLIRLERNGQFRGVGIVGAMRRRQLAKERALEMNGGCRLKRLDVAEDRRRRSRRSWFGGRRGCSGPGLGR